MDIKDYTKDIDSLIDSAQWIEAQSIMEFKKNNDELSKPELFKLGLIYFNLQHYEKGFAIFASIDWSDYRDCTWLRRKIIAQITTQYP